MLEREGFESGWRVRLRPQGFGRFVVAGFLGVWLCGWAAGEYFAGGTLLAGLRELLAPGLDLPWLPRMRNAAPANAWPVLAFLGLWVTFWTLGGLFAIVQAARALAGLDEVRWDSDGVEVVRTVGPFASRRRIAWAATHELFAGRRGALVAQTGRGLAQVTAFGGDEDRRQLALWLSEAWRQSRGGESEARAAAEQVPSGWTLETGEDGRPFLASAAGPRRAGAAALGAIGAALAFAAAALGANARGIAPIVGATVFTALALAALAGATWFALGRDELRPGPCSLRRVRRLLGREWTREVAPARLRLESSRDSDGDERWTLVAGGPGGPLGLASALNSPGAARHMGLWLAARMGVGLEGLPESGADETRRAG